MNAPSIPEQSTHKSISRYTEVIPTQDGWHLHADILAPKDPVGVVILGHAMMVSRRCMDRPRGAGLASRLAAANLATIVPDLRGHGESGPGAAQGGRWSYDDFVEQDTPALVAFARERFPDLKLCLAGHSLFGHVSAAYAGRAASPPEALVLLAANVWVPTLEPRTSLWALKRLTIEAILKITRARGYFPARALGIGSDDEPLEYFEQFLTWARTGRWQSRAGENYLSGLARFSGKTLAVVGAADRLNCRPTCARLFAERLGGSVDFLIAGRQSGPQRYALPFDPDHMSLVLDARATPLWDHIAHWIAQSLSAS